MANPQGSTEHRIEMVEYYFQDQLRWSFGFENPNKAAALIASLLPLLWMVAQAGWRIRRPTLKWPLVLFGSAVLCAGWWLLFMTYSRGGIVAAAAGFLYIGWRERTIFMARENRARLTLALITTLCVAVLFATTNAAERSTQWVGKHEGSVENRFELWRGGLEMIAQIPQGVGRGKSGAVYMQWFQPLNSTTRYRTLVNSYLTFAAEQGLAIFGCVIFAAAAFWAGTNNPNCRWGIQAVTTGAQGSLVAFVTAGLFSTTMEEWVLWVFPAACMLVLASITIRSKERQPWLRTLKVATGAGLGICAALYGSGWDATWGEPLRIADQGETIRVKPAHITPQRHFLVWVDEAVLGEDAGKLLRRLALERNAVVSVGGEARGDEVLVVTGESVSRLSASESGRELVLIAPARIEETTATAILRAAKSVTMFTPSFDDDGRVAFWRKAAAETGIKPLQLEGVGSQVEWVWDDLVNKL